MPKLLILFSILCWSQFLLAQTPEQKSNVKNHVFAGRISRINKTARLARIRTDYGNIKFLRRQDRVEFWNESYPEQRCQSFVEGRSNEYLLVRIPDYDSCIRKIHFTTGSYLHMQSGDLNQTLDVAGELVEVLQKKRIIMVAKKRRAQLELDKHVEKVNVVNQRYEVLRQKLEIEWKKELASLEEDKAREFSEFKNAEARLNEIESKLDAYRIEDHNLKIDRWSLDPALYQAK